MKPITLTIPPKIARMLKKNEARFNITIENQILNLLQDSFNKSKAKEELSIKKLNAIKSVVSEVYGITTDLYISRSRKRELTEPRFTAIYFTKKFTKLSLKSIGENYCRIDHSSVINAVNSYEDLLWSDKKIKQLHPIIEAEIINRFNIENYV